MKRIKTLSQRLQNGTFSSPYPIGTDGLLVDMLSGSSLEEEMHLGSPTETSFSQDENNVMTITEVYKKEESQTSKYYIMVTTFEVENDNIVIKQALSFVNEDGTVELKKTKIVTFESLDKNLTIKEVVE